MKTLPMVRPVEEKWECKRSGDCCTKPGEIVMTKEEASLLVLHAPSTIRLEFRPTDDERFVAMKAGPCPLFIFKSCIVYTHRPYNCRRFICMRPDPSTEEFDVNGANMMDRANTSRVARRRAELEQRRAQRWANNRGWAPLKETTDGPDTGPDPSTLGGPDAGPADSGRSGPGGSILIRGTARGPALR